MLVPLASPETGLDEKVDAEREDEEDPAEDDAVPEFALGRLEGDRGRDVAGDVADVAAEHHGDADLGDGPGEAGQHGDEEREAGLPQDDPPGLARRRTEGQGGLAGTQGNPEQEEAQEELAIDYNGEPMEIGFNVSYISEAVGALDNDEIEFCLNDPNSSCLLRVPGNSKHLYVVMPMRL